ncbi:hypothetical protein OLEAN_C11490 [Oleispira antarctica RB-8]|uniref:Uncharacterized protein n=1 Tax=Oleispira antarctica RB-8 TaxID=698738 RepID=R4YLD6_OLEAN|nr:hypothetical protein OLEAN_C11490 [Oleispira antarctica RB-8]
MKFPLTAPIGGRVLRVIPFYYQCLLLLMLQYLDPQRWLLYRYAPAPEHRESTTQVRPQSQQPSLPMLSKKTRCVGSLAPFSNQGDYS